MFAVLKEIERQRTTNALLLGLLCEIFYILNGLYIFFHSAHMNAAEQSLVYFSCASGILQPQHFLDKL